MFNYYGISEGSHKHIECESKENREAIIGIFREHAQNYGLKLDIVPDTTCGFYLSWQLKG